MGLYLRKSVRVGPFRFNLSSSGIGVSTGIKGLRVGMGPRGNYVQMGVGGLYYRKTFTLPTEHRPSKHDHDIPRPAPIPAFSSEGMTQITSGSISAMTDSTSAELLKELNEKKRRLLTWPFVAVLSLLLVCLVDADWFKYTLLVIGAASAIAAYQWDQVKKTTVIFYQLDSALEMAVQQLHDAFKNMQSSNKSWHIQAARAVRYQEQKYQAGAGHLVDRKPMTLINDLPRFVKSNVNIPTIPIGKGKLCFFPDKVLVFNHEGVGAVSYADLDIAISDSRFIESDSVPRDAEIVGTTWRYVNKNGGPDRRFKNNRQLPIALYESMHFKSSTGLNELIELSKRGVAEEFKASIKKLTGLQLSINAAGS